MIADCYAAGADDAWIVHVGPGPRMSTLSETLAVKRDRLLRLIASYGSCVVAYSGGVDSAVVAKAASLMLGDQVVIATGVSLSLADGELEQARHVAELIGARHVVLETNEFDNPDYVANAPDRCFHCKTELYTRLQNFAEREGLAVVLNGANADDLGDHRPGMRAAAIYRVRSPLIECEMTKKDVRQLAAEWQLPVAEKPATPCLSSRVAYGVEVTPERLRMIDAAEQLLRSLGVSPLRVRYHTGDVARIEVPLEDLYDFCESDIRNVVVDELHELGFKFVTLDLEGFRSGSLTQLVQLDDRQLVESRADRAETTGLRQARS